MPSRCEFFFDHPDAVYYSGEVVNGKIVLTTDKVKRVRGIYLTIKGAAKVHWSERKSRRRNNKTEYYTVYYRGDQQYLHSQVMVEREMDFPPGVHEYTFSTPLPPQIPSSISGQHGQITYEVELKLDRPLRMDNEYANSFTVIKPLDLNMDPSFLTPSIGQAEKTFCCCCCASRPVKAELRTEFSGYAPGQKINFTLLIDNESNNELDGSVVKLKRSMFFRSQTPQVKVKHVQNEIGRCVLDGARRLTKKLHKGSIRMPAMPATTMNTTDIIGVSYYLEAEIQTGFFSTNLDLMSAITIGTVPLIASATNPNSIIVPQPTAPSPDTPNDEDKPPQYSSVVPPTFEEAIRENDPFVDPDAKENRVQEPFVPKYPVYHNFATPSAPAEERTPLIQESQSSTWQSPPAIPGAQQPLTEQPRTSQNNLPYPVNPLPNVPPVPGVGSPQEKGNGPTIGWQS